MDFDLKKIREAKRLSQAEMARELGVAQSTVCRIENGQEPSGPMRLLITALQTKQPQEAA